MKLNRATTLLYAGMFVLVTGVSLIQSCTQDTAEAGPVLPSERGQILRIDEAGYHLQLNVPFHPTDTIAALAALNTNTGELDIMAGGHFGLRIIQESRSVEQFKGDMKSLNLFRMRIVEETPEWVVYQSVLPDGTAHYFHIYATVTIGGRPYTVRSAPERDFTEADVMRMKEALMSLRPL